MVILKRIIILLLLPTLGHAGYRNPVSSEELERTPVGTSQATPTASQPSNMPMASAQSTPTAQTPDHSYLKSNYAPVKMPSMPDVRKPASLPHFDLSGMNREEVRKFAEDALKLPLPTKEYGLDLQAKNIAKKYSAALHPVVHKSIRTDLTIILAKLLKIVQPEQETPFLWQLKRFDALLQILENNNYFSMSELWWLGAQKQSTNEHRYRDNLFAGIAAQRAGINYAAYNLYHNAIGGKIESNPHYLGLLWDQIVLLPPQIRQRLIREQTSDGWKKLEIKNAWTPLLIEMATLSDSERWHDIQARLKNNKFGTASFDLLLAQRNPSATELESVAKNSNRELSDHAHLQLARLKAADGEWQAAYEHYHAIRDRAPQLLSLLSEEAFIESRLGLWRQSLGKSLSLQSDFFRYGFAPEAYLLEANSRKSLCDYGGAEQALKKFRSVYNPEAMQLNAFTKNFHDDKDRYEGLLEIGLPTQAPRFARYLLQLPEVQQAQAFVHEWWTESQQLAKFPKPPYEHVQNPEVWREFVSVLEKNRQEIKTKEFARAGSIALGEAKHLYSKVQAILDQCELMQLDIAAKASSEIHLQSALNFPVRAPASEAPIPANKNDWGYRQELWEDELESLESKLPSRCVEDQRS